MIARLFALWLFYLLVSGQLAVWVGFATTAPKPSGGQTSGGAMPGLPSLPVP